jgi:tRNA(Ile)-lysidine synthase
VRLPATAPHGAAKGDDVSRGIPSAIGAALRDAGVRPGDRAVVAVSGGVDSMVLLDVLVRLAPRLGLRLHVVHVHHGLRGQSADRDAALVSDAASRYGLPMLVERLRPETRPNGTSVQVWAREARYACLESVRAAIRGTWVLTAHTRDDQAETVLLNLLRGAGPRGLAGIPGRRARILRPLLCVSRRDIASYAAARRVAFRDDRSNRSVAYRRNRIRLQLLPLLAREYNPRIVETLAALAMAAREDDDALTAAAETLASAAVRVRGGSVGVSLALLSAAAPAIARRLLQGAFRRATEGRHGLTRRHVSALLDAATHGGRVYLPGGVLASASAGYLRFGPGAPAWRSTRPEARQAAGDPPAEVPVRPGRWARWDPAGCFVRVRRVLGARPRTGSADSRRALLSPTVLDQPLRLRAWRPGDRFRPLGLGGEKKLQDFFVDAKLPREERHRVPLLVAGECVAWVVGHRVAETFAWKRGRRACLAEVRFAEGAHGVPPGSHAAVGR